MLQNNRRTAVDVEGGGAGHRAVGGDARVGPRCERARPIRLVLLISTALLTGACGTTYTAAASRPRPVALSPWPSAADYGTIKTAVAVRDDALFHQRDWRRKSFAASLALRTLLTCESRRAPARSTSLSCTAICGTSWTPTPERTGDRWSVSCATSRRSHMRADDPKMTWLDSRPMTRSFTHPPPAHVSGRVEHHHRHAGPGWSRSTRPASSSRLCVTAHGATRRSLMGLNELVLCAI